MFQQVLAGTRAGHIMSATVSTSLLAASWPGNLRSLRAVRQGRPIFRMRPRFWRNPRALRLKYRERKQKDARVSRLRTELKFLHELIYRWVLPTGSSLR